MSRRFLIPLGAICLFLLGTLYLFSSDTGERDGRNYKKPVGHVLPPRSASSSTLPSSSSSPLPRAPRTRPKPSSAPLAPPEEPVEPILTINPLIASHTLRAGEEAVPAGFVPGAPVKWEDHDAVAKSCPVQPIFALVPHYPIPDYCMIGVAKGGTTSLSRYLSVHPHISASKVKEPNFWSWKYIPTLAYHRQFVNRYALNETILPGSFRTIAGEYSTSYVAHPLVPRRMYSQLPDIKLILFLRNPTDRCYSHYVMSKRAGLETEEFEMVIEREMEEVDALLRQFRHCFNDAACDIQACLPKNFAVRRHDAAGTPYFLLDELDLKDYLYTSYVFRSIYVEQIERWFATFPREQILIVTSEEFYDNTVAVLDRITDFLRIPRHDFEHEEMLQETWGGGASNAFDAHDYAPMRNETRLKLDSFFAPYNERLSKLLKMDLAWNKGK